LRGFSDNRYFLINKAGYSSWVSSIVSEILAKASKNMKDIPVYKNKKRHDQLLARYAGEAYFDCLYLEQKYSGYYHYKLFDQLLLACIYCPPITIDELLY